MPKPTKAYYFGTYRKAGHYLHGPDLQHVWPKRDHAGQLIEWAEDLPWTRIDGTLTPRHGVEGEAALHYYKGWTALAFVNYTDDQRPGSNSAFFFDEKLSFDEAVAAAREFFPSIVKKFQFEITLHGVVVGGG